jgi:hypothetical protein
MSSPFAILGAGGGLSRSSPSAILSSGGAPPLSSPYAILGDGGAPSLSSSIVAGSLPTPEEYSGTTPSLFGPPVPFSFSFCGFNPDTVIVYRGSDSQISAILGQIPKLKIGKNNGPKTTILISTSPAPTRTRDIDDQKKSDDRVINDNYGVVVPKEHALKYTQALFKRYQIMVEKGEWLEPSQATKNRSAVDRSRAKIQATYQAGEGTGSNTKEYKKAQMDKHYAKRARTDDDDENS